MASPHLNLEHYTFTRILMLTCPRCEGYTRHEAYEGGAYAYSSKLYYCMDCGLKTPV